MVRAISAPGATSTSPSSDSRAIASSEPSSVAPNPWPDPTPFSQVRGDHDVVAERNSAKLTAAKLVAMVSGTRPPSVSSSGQSSVSRLSCRKHTG